MFTDDRVPPIHLETLIDLLREARSKELDAQTIPFLLQPDGLPDVKPERGHSKLALKAAQELGIVQRDQGSVTLLIERKDKRSTREIVLEALESHVLSSLEVEPYFALYYSYLLGLGKKADDRKKTRDQWASEFNAQVFRGQKQSNPFNADKVSGLHRWFRYAGLGWYDPAGVFQCNPYERLRRALPRIFEGKRKLQGGPFMEGLAGACPELDGGVVFRQAVPTYNDADRVCTLGLSHALVDLHLDGHLVLHCPQDSSGWSLQEADPPLDNQTLRSARIDFVEWRKAR
jgi:hypothetical protein